MPLSALFHCGPSDLYTQQATDGFLTPDLSKTTWVIDKDVMEKHGISTLTTRITDAKVSFVKKHELAKLPTKAHDDDTGFDVYCVERTEIAPGESKVVPIGLQLGYITPGYWIMIECRSGLGFKHNLTVHNGVIDNGYRGSLDILVRNLDKTKFYRFDPGDRVAQLVIHRNYCVDVEFTHATIESVRGTKGFGSSGQ